MSSSRTVLMAALVALVQIGFLGWVLMSRAAVLRDGREVLLKVEPIDPRDLLRGDYVRLGYDIGQIPVERIDNFPAGPATTGTIPIFVRVSSAPDGIWKLDRASLEKPLAVPPEPTEVDIRGEVEGWALSQSAGSTVRPTLGIERFYLPEGEGLQIEQDMRTRPFFVKLAVAEDGTAQIKQFLDGDKPLYTEPLY